MASESLREPDQVGLVRQAWRAGWLTKFLGFEVLMAAIALVALQTMETSSTRGVIVGIAISLGVMVFLTVVVAAVWIGVRRVRRRND
jgi:threonine/homoserine/homoserine lactone efflux protein